MTRRAIFRLLWVVLLSLTQAFATHAGSRTTLPPDIASGWGNVWLKSMENGFKKYGFSIEKSHNGVSPRLGKSFIKFEVRPGDCGNNGGWDDCANDRERHELSQRAKLQSHGQEYWYSWSIHIPKETPYIFPTYTHLGQFHQRRNNVLWLLSWRQGGYVVDNQVPGDGQTKETATIVPADELQGKWHDILIHAKWSHTKAGFFNVYANHQLKYDYRGQTIAKGDQSNLKFGIYRSFVSRYMRKAGVSKVPKQVVHYDEVHRHSSLSKVDRVGIAKLQSILAEEGLYKGAIDGLWGGNTRKSLNTFLSSRNQQPFQHYDLKIWQVLKDDPDYAKQTSQPSFDGPISALLSELQKNDAELIKAWQSYLRNSGFYNGSIDGISNLDLLKSVIACKAKDVCKL